MANYAIIIGINNYTPPEQQGLRALNGAITDAEKMADWVKAAGQVPSKNCHLITSTANPLAPVKNIIDTKIAAIVQDIKVNFSGNADRFYFYFAGHGLGIEQDPENNALCMADWSEWMRDAAALSSRDYKRKFLSEGLFKEIVIWMDCCRNSKMYLNPLGGPGVYPGLGPNLNPKWFVGFAAQYQNQAFEANNPAIGDPDKRGVFTRVLLEGLNGGAQQNGRTTADDIRDYLTYHVPIEAQNAGYAQNPEIAHNTSKYDPLLF